MLEKRFFGMIMLIVGFILLFALSGCDFLTGDKDDKDDSGDLFTVKSADGWNNAIKAIKQGGDNKEYTITVTGNFSVPGSNYSPTFGYNSGITVTLKGSGTISLSSSGHLLDISVDHTVIVKDLTLRGFSGSGSVVDSGGNFRMEGSASVTGNTGTGVIIGGGTFTMQDNASITNNTSTSLGGGVALLQGTFIMKDNASVSGNTLTGYRGGGVRVDAGREATSFIMQDNASVSGNSGVGVSVEYGTFTMRDNASVTNNTATNGGGVWVAATFNMQGGTISGNSASDRGGGLFVSDSKRATFTMQGGTISGNSAGENGGGMYINGHPSSTTANKTGGIIYGSDEGLNSNTASSGKGHAVYYNRTASYNYFRNTTVGQDINLDFMGISTGFWEND